MLQRLSNYFASASPGTLQLTGVLGLAVFLYGWYHLRFRVRKPDSGGHPSDQPSSSYDTLAGKDPSASFTNLQVSAAAKPTAKSTAEKVRSRLQGIRRVTISVPGVLLHESSPSQLEESATPHEESVVFVREVAKVVDLYLIAHVGDDIGEATVRGALESVGIIGQQAGQVKPHRVLFCATLDGKMSLVRQLEPDLHIDGHSKTVDDLKRFLSQLLLVDVGSSGFAPTQPNIGVTTSVVQYFNS